MSWVRSKQLGSPCIMLVLTLQRRNFRCQVGRTLRLGLVDNRRFLSRRLRLSQRQQLQRGSGFFRADRPLACDANTDESVRQSACRAHKQMPRLRLRARPFCTP